MSNKRSFDDAMGGNMGRRRKQDDRYTPHPRDIDRYPRNDEPRHYPTYTERRESHGSPPVQQPAQGPRPRPSSSALESARHPPPLGRPTNTSPVTAPPTPAISTSGLGLDGASDSSDPRQAIVEALRGFSTSMAESTLATFYLAQAKDDVASCKSTVDSIPSGTQGDFAAMARQAQRSLKLAEDRFAKRKEKLEDTQKESQDVWGKLADHLLASRPSSDESQRVKDLEDRLQQQSSLLAELRKENINLRQETDPLKDGIQKVRSGYSNLLQKVNVGHTSTRAKEEVLENMVKEVNAKYTSTQAKEEVLEKMVNETRTSLENNYSSLRADMQALTGSFKTLEGKQQKLEEEMVEPFMACAEASANVTLLEKAVDEVKARLVAKEKTSQVQPLKPEDFARVEADVRELKAASRSLQEVIHGKKDAGGSEAPEQTSRSLIEKVEANETRIEDAEETMKGTSNQFAEYVGIQDEHNASLASRVQALAGNGTSLQAGNPLEQDVRFASIEQRLTKRFERLHSDIESVQHTLRFLNSRYNNVSTQDLVARMAQQYDQHYGFASYRHKVQELDKRAMTIDETLRKWQQPYNAMNTSLIGVRNEMSSLTSKVTKLEKSVENIVMSYGSLTSKTDARLNDIDEQLKHVRPQIEDTRKRIEEATSSVDLRFEEMSKAIDTCNTNDTIRERKLSDLSIKQAELAKSFHSEELSACQKQLHECKNELKTFSSSIAKIEDIQREFSETKAELTLQKSVSDELQRRVTSNSDDFVTHVAEFAEYTEKTDHLSRALCKMDRASDRAKSKSRATQPSADKGMKQASEQSGKRTDSPATGKLNPPHRSQDKTPTPSSTTIRSQSSLPTVPNTLQSTPSGADQGTHGKSSGVRRDTPGQQPVNNAKAPTTKLSATSQISVRETPAPDSRSQNASGSAVKRYPPSHPTKAANSGSLTTPTTASARTGTSTPLKSENTFIPPHAMPNASGPSQPRATAGSARPSKTKSATIVISDDEDDTAHPTPFSSGTKKHDRPRHDSQSGSAKHGKKKQARQPSPEL